MTPSYFRISLSIGVATTRLCAWAGMICAEPPQLTDSASAFRLACDPSGKLRGAALFVSFSRGWTIFNDLGGNFSFIPAQEWLQLAESDSLLVASYNDAVGYAELVSIDNGRIQREFVYSSEDPESNVNSGQLDSESQEPFRSWVEVASIVDADDLFSFFGTGELWLLKASPR